MNLFVTARILLHTAAWCGAVAAWAAMEPPGFLQVARDGLDYDIEEGSTRVITIERHPASPLPATVEYHTLDGPELPPSDPRGVARAGRDYAAIRGMLEFAPGETRKTLLLTALPNGRLDSVGSRSFTLILTNPTPPLQNRTRSVEFRVVDRELPPNRDPWFAPSVGGGPIAVLKDGRVLVVHDARSETRSTLNRLMPDGQPDPAFHPISFANREGRPGPPAEVVVSPDGGIMVSGPFDFVADRRVPGIARLNDDGTLDEGFQPATNLTAETRPRVQAIRRSGHIVVSHDTGRGQEVLHCHRHGGLDPAFAPVRVRGTVEAVAEDAAGRLVLAGSFSEVDGEPRGNLARLLPDGTLDGGFRPSLDAVGMRLWAREDGRILVQGDFQTINGISRPFLARLDPSGAVDPTFAEQPGHFVNLVSDRDGGTIGVTAGRRIVRLDADGREIEDLGELRVEYSKFAGSYYPARLALHGDGLLIGDPFMRRFQGVLGAPLGRLLLRPPRVAFSVAPSTPAQAERNGLAVFEICRAGDTLDHAVVQYRTRSLSGRAGTDFAETEGTLEFAPLEWRKTVMVRLIDDQLLEGPESFELQLSRFDEDGLERPVAAPATQWILDDETRLRVETRIDAGIPSAEVRLETASEAWWQIEASADMVRWEPTTGVLTGTERYRNPLMPGTGHRFFRAMRLD